MIGYEARARITADVSGLVTSQRQAAQATGQLAAALIELNKHLVQTSRLASQAASGVQPLIQTSRQLNQTQNQSAQSASGLADAMRQGAAAQNMAADTAHMVVQALQQQQQAQQAATQQTQRAAQAQQSASRNLNAMGRELNRLRADQERYQGLVRQGVTLNRDQQESFARVEARIGQLTAQFIGLSAAERRQVTAARELAQAQRMATQAMQEQNAAQLRLNQTGAMTHSQLQQLGRQMVTLERQERSLTDIQRQRGTLNAEEARLLAAVRAQVNELAAAYARLTAAQRGTVDRSADLMRVSTASREATAAFREQERAAQDLNGSHWAMRSALQDVAFSMDTVWQLATRSTAALWENYSAQEMAIAQISRVSQATSSELREITDQVRQMSMDIPIAFAELGNISMLGSQVGIANDQLANFTETVALFAATSEISADETATMLARIMQMADVPQTEVMNLASSVAALGSNSAATDKEILTTIESIATMTSAVGLSTEATIGLGGAMASLVIRPELARGAAQRVFLQLGNAVGDAGAEMERMQEITGLTQAEMENLIATDYDQFFFTFLEGLNGLYNSGEQLVPVLREIGIRNTRDADVVARLAQNYDLLSDQVDLATSSFAAGNYLYSESDRIFSTLTNRIQLLRNTWSAFFFDVFESLAPYITAVVEAATATGRFLTEVNAAPVVAFGVAALGVVSTLALLVSLASRAYAGFLALRGAWNLMTGAAVANTAATTANAAATNAGLLARTRAAVATGAQTAATAANTAATTAAVGAQVSMAAALARMGLSANAATVGMTRMAGATAGAAAASRAFILTPFGAVIAGIAAAVALAATAFQVFGDETERANERIRTTHEVHLMAAGGMDALRLALEADTKAWRDVTEAAEHNRNVLGRANAEINEAVRNSNYRIMSSMDMSEADRAAADEAERLAEANSWVRDSLNSSTRASQDAGAANSLLADEMSRYGSEADRTAARLDGVQRASADLLTESERTTYAVGAATYQMGALSAESALLETGILESAEAFEIFKNTGVDLGTGIALELQTAGEGAEYFRSRARDLLDDMGMFERQWNQVVLGITATGEQLPAISRLFSSIIPDSWATDTGQAADALLYLGDNAEATSLSLEAAARQTELAKDTFIELPNGTRATVEELAAMAEEGAEAGAVMQMMEVEASALGVTLEELHTAFTSFFDPLESWNTALATANEGLEDQYESLLQVEGGFGLYLDELEKSNQAQQDWIGNLARLGATGDVPADVIAGLIQMGTEGAEIVQGLANANDEEVARFVEAWDMGMGATSELFTTMFADFLTMAVTTGDTAGTDFIFELMEKVAAGDITFREAVDEMTTYAEEEFQNADTTNQPMLDNTQALIDLTNLISRVEGDIDDADTTADIEADTDSAYQSVVDFTAWLTTWFARTWFANVEISAPKLGHAPMPKYRDGGWISGDGGPRADKVPILASNDEFMVNARSAARWAPLLEWINSDGKMPSSRQLVPDMAMSNMDRVFSQRSSGVHAMADPAFYRSAATQREAGGPRTVIKVTNYYPVAEPTSVTTNKSLQFAAGLDGVL